MTSLIPKTAASRGVLALAAASSLLAGCSTVEGLFSGDKVDYRTQAAKTAPLEVPPDLTQLARDGRFRPQGGVVSAANAGAATAPGAAVTAATAAPLVAPQAIGEIKVEREGNVRWLVVPMTPEQLWPQLRAFWQERGFALEIDNPQTGVMETAWAEDRSKIPDSLIRRAIGGLLDSLYSTGERDRYRTRVERVGDRSEVFISHRGMTEVVTGQQRDNTVWQPRPADPQLEAVFLSRLMVKLGTPQSTATAALDKAPEAAPRARPTAPGTVAAANTATSIDLDDGFDRGWRRVGLALDRTGFTVEDRDRAAGLYYVRYIDPKFSGKEEPGFFSKLFGSSDKSATAERYRVLVKAEGNKTRVSVQDSTGKPDGGETAKRIVGLLIPELR